MLRYARIRGLKRSDAPDPRHPGLVHGVRRGTDDAVPYPIAYALIGGLSADSVVKHPEALTVFPEVELIDFDSATRTRSNEPIHSTSNAYGHGLPGFLYWYLLYPFHWLRFHVLFRNIARQS
jgi:hypothetical protein